MRQMELYQILAERPEIPHALLRSGHRIAAKYGHELDIMKIADIGYSNIAQGQVAVAMICPGQASFRLKNTGELSLNSLVDVQAASTYRQQQGLRGMSSEGDVLVGYEKAHWLALMGVPIVLISKQEMKGLQELVRPLAPELFALPNKT